MSPPTNPVRFRRVKLPHEVTLRMTFDHLTDGQFEELTYDLLGALGFANLSWRRSSGKGGASADNVQYDLGYETGHGREKQKLRKPTR